MALNTDSTRSGLLPTPPLPADLPPVELTENARQVLLRRYVRRADDGKPGEAVEDMFWRVAYNVARVEETWEGDVLARARDYYRLLTSKAFFPNSPTFTGAGTPLGQLAACFVLPVSDDMGRKTSGIFQTLRDAALIQQTGGGNGFNFSRLRPKGCVVKSSAGQATGPVGFLRVYDHAFGEVAQGGCLLPRWHAAPNRSPHRGILHAGRRRRVVRILAGQPVQDGGDQRQKDARSHHRQYLPHGPLRVAHSRQLPATSDQPPSHRPRQTGATRFHMRGKWRFH